MTSASSSPSSQASSASVASAIETSISDDGSQVVYSTQAGGCDFSTDAIIPTDACRPDEIVAARALVDRIHVDDRIRDYVVDLVIATRDPDAAGVQLGDLVDYGASPRASIALLLVAKSRAFLDGRGFVVPQDVKDAAPDVLRHRLGLSYEAEAEGRTADDVVRALLDHVPVP